MQALPRTGPKDERHAPGCILGQLGQRTERVGAHAQPTGPLYNIFIGDGSSACVDVFWGGTDDGTTIDLANCTGNDNQDFNIVPAKNFPDIPISFTAASASTSAALRPPTARTSSTGRAMTRTPRRGSFSELAPRDCY